MFWRGLRLSPVPVPSLCICLHLLLLTLPSTLLPSFFSLSASLPPPFLPLVLCAYLSSRNTDISTAVNFRRAIPFRIPDGNRHVRLRLASVGVPVVY
ncbi:hypothetical protein DFH06DRAFT_599481 [Mycena polygramma]|nr:hypothetical protein DFH06DRAFT_599481 [Mycena polygramma]